MLGVLLGTFGPPNVRGPNVRGTFRLPRVGGTFGPPKVGGGTLRILLGPQALGEVR